MINKHKSNKIKENSNTVRHLNNGTDHRHSKSCCDQSSPARRTMTTNQIWFILSFLCVQLFSVTYFSKWRNSKWPTRSCEIAYYFESWIQKKPASIANGFLEDGKVKILRTPVVPLFPFIDVQLTSPMAMMHTLKQAFNTWGPFTNTV